MILSVIVYDPSVWTEFGFIVQRYIGSAATIGILAFAVVIGVGLVARIITWLIGL